MWTRINGLMLRNVYLYRRSLPRIMGIVFWPVMNLMLWGFLTRYLRKMDLPIVIDYLLGAVILWDVLYRAQQSITLLMTEEFWVKNVLNIFIAPIRNVEFVLAITIIGLVKSLLTTVLLALLALFCYQFNLLSLGLGLALFYGNLMLFGWALGLITMALVFRYGHAAEALIWGIPFLIQPISAVYYPVAVLPVWLKAVAYMLPSTYVFEGMRTVLNFGNINMSMLLLSTGLNILYLAAAGGLFAWTLKQARKKGYLSRTDME